jgi:hypothetical protein
MPDAYRDDLDALKARHAALSEQLTALRARANELRDLEQFEQRLTKELSDVAKRLEGMSARRALPILENLRIAAPCDASWETMQGDARVRFCGQCEKNVYNLSAMERTDAEKLLAEHGESLCVRLYKRADGTVITADCPVGLRRLRRRRFVAAAALGAGLVAGLTSYLAMSARSIAGSPFIPVGTIQGGLETSAPISPPPPETKTATPSPTQPAPPSTTPPANTAHLPLMGKPATLPADRSSR